MTGPAPGDRVVLNGFRVGEAWWGGFAERAWVNPDWLVKLPDPLSTRDAMAVGTAGFTAMMAVDALERGGLVPGTGPVLVTGASGGVGSFAIHILARLGYEVHASTGRLEHAEYLRGLGAAEVIDRAELAEQPAKPLLSERWAGGVDAVGGATLAHVLAELRYGAAVAVCGNTAGNDLPTTVLPFILRGVRLLGIDSVMMAASSARAVVAPPRRPGRAPFLAGTTTESGLADLPARADEILAGQVRGRVVVDVNR